MLTDLLFALLALSFFAGTIALLIVLFSKIDFSNIESDEKRAGRKGEEFVSSIIAETLKDDVLLTNVKIAVDGRQAELDNVIINNRGVFIIEAKNYTGTLIGSEDDEEWIKNKVTSAGNFYQKNGQKSHKAG